VSRGANDDKAVSLWIWPIIFRERLYDTALGRTLSRLLRSRSLSNINQNSELEFRKHTTDQTGTERGQARTCCWRKMKLLILSLYMNFRAHNSLLSWLPSCSLLSPSILSNSSSFSISLNHLYYLS
jgi:hypothetical protein